MNSSSWTWLKLPWNARKKQKAFYSGKKKRHTLKTQVVVKGTTRQVICTAHGRGSTHDFVLYKRSKFDPHESLELLADSGYQGLSTLHDRSRTPKKRSKKVKLTRDERRVNRELSRRRIVVEHDDSQFENLSHLVGTLPQSKKAILLAIQSNRRAVQL